MQQRIQWYREEYLETPAGQKHLARMEAEAREVKKVVEDLRRRHQTGEDITDHVLRRLLPHSDSEFHRENDYRISTWPCVRKDVRGWFEGAGWKEPADWPPTARLLFEAVNGLISGDKAAWDAFLKSEYRHGFGTGFVSPILFCLDKQYPVINSKVVKTYRYCTAQLDGEDRIDAKLGHYLENAEKVKALQKRLKPLGLKTIYEWDIFCHYMVSKSLGGGDLTKRTEPEYAAWLFVANPEIFQWEEAFEQNGVDWTRSLGPGPQKLLRRSIRGGDRVFGYQAGPDYEICCELEVAPDPYKTSDGTWAARLVPVRRIAHPISLSAIKAHPVLSDLTFVKQPQLSISGVTRDQLEALERLISEPGIQVEISPVDQLCAELRAAQYDTSNSERFEKRIAQAFERLGLEAEHRGAPGQPDIVVVGKLGSETYTAIVEAKTCQEEQVVNAARVSYSSISDHKEEHTADHVLVVAPAFAGGKIVQHAIKNQVAMLTADALISILRRHEQFPFSIPELQPLFAASGPAGSIADELGRVHAQHDDYIRLTSIVLQLFDELQRQQDVSEPISSTTIYFLLLGRAQGDEIAAPDRGQIDHVLSLLANPVLGILAEEEGGYVLTLSPPVARRRLTALESVLASEE